MGWRHHPSLGFGDMVKEVYLIADDGDVGRVSSQVDIDQISVMVIVTDPRGLLLERASPRKTLSTPVSTSVFARWIGTLTW